MSGSVKWAICLGGVSTLACALFIGFLVADHGTAPVYVTRDFQSIANEVLNKGLGRDECVSIVGSAELPLVQAEPCGSSASTYRVVQHANSPAGCVSDVDIAYSYATDTARGALCMDYDWSAGHCMTISEKAVSKDSCAELGSVKPTFVVVGGVDVSYCRSGGVPHPIRRFTVCTSPN
ncbi:LppU/SCO3897 family protein [Mycobacteroides chelonae]|uniref:LppU/SCO3897 family protein n=1 Tax=Mycobacteroides chelonae TaxID=1774 RepID=UPI003B97DD6C